MEIKSSEFATEYYVTARSRGIHITLWVGALQVTTVPSLMLGDPVSANTNMNDPVSAYTNMNVYIYICEYI